MEDVLRIDFGVKRLLINGGPDFLEFNPTSISFAEKFYKLKLDLDEKNKEYSSRSEAINLKRESGSGQDMFPEVLALSMEVCVYMREQIDILFGPGTSQTVFKDNNSLNMFEQFFSGITPYIEEVRKKKVSKYISTPRKKKETVIMGS